MSGMLLLLGLCIVFISWPFRVSGLLIVSVDGKEAGFGFSSPVISGYITVFMSMIWFCIFIPSISIILPFMSIISFIIFIPAKYFSLGSLVAGTFSPLPSHSDADLVRSSGVTRNSYLLFSGIVTTTSYVSDTAMINLSTSTGSTSFPSVATTVILPPE